MRRMGLRFRRLARVGGIVDQLLGVLEVCLRHGSTYSWLSSTHELSGFGAGAVLTKFLFTILQMGQRGRRLDRFPK